MTTSPSRAAALLAALAAPAAAQDVTLPSGLAATLFDVVLEPAGAAPLAPDASSDPDGAEDAGAEGGLPLDMPAGDPLAGQGGDATTGGIARFRLLVPGLGGEGAGYERVADDFAWACAALALPALAANGWAPSEVVIALADREVPFGEADPEAVQFFEGFRIAEGLCIPQAF